MLQACNLHLTHVTGMLHTLPAWAGVISVARRGSRDEAGRLCGVQAEGHCRAGQLLGALGLDISLPGVRAATPASARDLLTLLLRQLADSAPPLSDARSAPCRDRVMWHLCLLYISFRYVQESSGISLSQITNHATVPITDVCSKCKVVVAMLSSGSQIHQSAWNEGG